MNPIIEITKIQDKLPISVVQDLHHRMASWLSDGGNYDDPYMFRQLDYAKSVLRRMENDDIDIDIATPVGVCDVYGATRQEKAGK